MNGFETRLSSYNLTLSSCFYPKTSTTTSSKNRHKMMSNLTINDEGDDENVNNLDHDIGLMNPRSFQEEDEEDVGNENQSNMIKIMSTRGVGRANQDVILQASNLCLEGCYQIYEILKGLLEDHARKELER